MNLTPALATVLHPIRARRERAMVERIVATVVRADRERKAGRTVALVLAAFLLAGCGAASSDAKPAAGKAPSYTDLRDLASALGCSGSYAHDPGNEVMYASDSATCSLASGEVSLRLFNNDDARDNYVKIGMANGGAYVVGHGWAVECQNRAEQDEAAKGTGGTRKG